MLPDNLPDAIRMAGEATANALAAGGIRCMVNYSLVLYKPAGIWSNDTFEIVHVKTIGVHQTMQACKERLFFRLGNLLEQLYWEIELFYMCGLASVLSRCPISLKEQF